MSLCRCHAIIALAILGVVAIRGVRAGLSSCIIHCFLIVREVRSREPYETAGELTKGSWYHVPMGLSIYLLLREYSLFTKVLKVNVISGLNEVYMDVFMG